MNGSRQILLLQSSKNSHLKVFVKKRVKKKKMFLIELNNAKSLVQEKNRGIEHYNHKLKQEERQRQETVTQIDIENKEQRRLQEKSREKFLSKLKKVVTPEGFEYYVDCSSANERGDDCFFMSDSDYEGSEDEETEPPVEFFGCT